MGARVVETLRRGARGDAPKWVFWAGVAALIVLSAWVDDRFVVNARDPEWGKLATWAFLLPHAVAGVVALLLGPFQFSDRLRTRRPALHRLCGRIYVGACLFAGPTAAFIALRHHPISDAVVQVFQGLLWTLATALALYYAMKRRLAPHKLWMMRSYGFCLIFVSARLPDIDPHFDWPGTPGVTVLWSGILIALIGPDLILAVREELRRSRP